MVFPLPLAFHCSSYHMVITLQQKYNWKQEYNMNAKMQFTASKGEIIPTFSHHTAITCCRTELPTQNT